MKSILKIAVICLLLAFNIHAEKKVTYGKSTFTLYKPVQGLAPLPTCGFVPTAPGYTLKNKNYGQGTYYCYAPGTVAQTSYKCILTEIRNWVGYKPDAVKEFATKKGLTLLDEKAMKKLFKNSSFPSYGLMYQLTDNSWIQFTIAELEHSNVKAGEPLEQLVKSVTFIEKIDQNTDTVLNRMYRFWNDGVRFSDYATIAHLNAKARATAPNDPNPNNFSIGEVLNPKKGFYQLSFAGGKPGYVWHAYDKVVSANLQKSDFAAKGQAGYNDLLAAFEFSMNMGMAGKNLYVGYTVHSRFYNDLEPGKTWQQEMAMRKDSEAKSKAAMQQVQKTNSVAMEKLYKEIFK